jgi:hypothetical protein
MGGGWRAVLPASGWLAGPKELPERFPFLLDGNIAALLADFDDGTDQLPEANFGRDLNDEHQRQRAAWMLRRGIFRRMRRLGSLLAVG